MSCDGVMIGLPLAGEKMLFGASISTCASVCASMRQRQVDGHLVAVEVGVEAFADQRVNLDGVAFDEHRLKRLDAHAVKRRSAIEHDRMLVDALLRGCPRLPGRGARASSWRT